MKNLKKWAEENQFDLPWRQNRSLYTTLVSEIMLQQTTVGTVLNHFQRFIHKFPDVKSVAEASEEELTIAWKGLGYYRRARNLKKACIEIFEKHHGHIPLEREKLLSIPGIGPYTAHAILSIGADRPWVAVDANLERVLSRFFALKAPKGGKLMKEIYALFEKAEMQSVLIEIGPRIFNEALMDIGRLYCKANKVYCQLCPLSQDCVAYKENNQLSLPFIIDKNLAKNKMFYELSLLRVIVQKQNSYLMYKKSDKEWLSGQWEFPTFVLDSTDDMLKQYPPTSLSLESLWCLPQYKTSITTYNITNYVLYCSEDEYQKYFVDLLPVRFMDFKKNENLSTASFKALRI